MATNLFQKIAVATAGTVLSLAVTDAAPAIAATITYDLTVNFYDDAVGNAYGSFSYDDSTINPAEPFQVGLTDFFLNFNGKTLTNSNADAFDISFHQYGLAEGAENCPEECGSDLLGIGVWDEWRFDFQIEYHGGSIVFLEPSDTQPGNYIAVGNASYEQGESPGEQATSVPEPRANVSLLGLGAVALAGLLRKKLGSSRCVA